MRSKGIFVVLVPSLFAVVLVAVLHPVQAQITGKSTIPKTVSSCYTNTTAYNRYTRKPMHIDNLISIIRKVELKDPQWDMRRIARVLVNRYIFDGMEFSSSNKPEYQYNPKNQESIKTAIVKHLIQLPIEEVFPDGILDNDELCALHWMLSHSMNTTARDDELMNPTYPGYGYGNSYPTNNNNNNNNNNMGGIRRQKRWVFDSQENDKTDPEKSDVVNKQQLVDSPAVAAQFVADSGEVFHLESDGDVQTGSKKFARQVSTIVPGATRRPVETGAVYTRWGTVSAGRVIAGIAAGLQPVTLTVNSGTPYASPGFGSPGGGYGSNGGNYPIPSNGNPFAGTGGNSNNNNGYANYPYPSKNQYAGRRKRQTSISFQPIQSIYAVTLAGDVGQAAIINGMSQIPNVPVPKGTWNDTICPREYVLEPHPDSTKEIFDDTASWTYLTESEIRGGMDGLILGMNIGRWDQVNSLRLSEVLEMYYSETGITGEPQYRSCNRGSLYISTVDTNVLREQCRSFAYYYNNQTKNIPDDKIEEDPNSFLRQIEEAYQKMSGIASTVSSMDPQCLRRQSTAAAGSLETDDDQKFIEIRNKIYAVLDHTATFTEIEAQKRFLAQLVLEINVSPKRSRLGVVDGNSGIILINPNSTDNGACLACDILKLPTQIKTQDNKRVLENLRSEIEKLKTEEMRMEFTDGEDNGITFLFMVQGKKLEESQKSEINTLIRQTENLHGDVHVMFTSSKYQQSDFDGFAIKPEYDFIKLNGVQNISDEADTFTQTFRTRSHARLFYPRCNANVYNQDNEHKIGTNFFLSPDTIQYYKIAPDYFHSSKTLRLRFSSEMGKVRICQARNEKYPNSKNQNTNGVSCKETTGSYVAPGSAQVDVEYSYSKPCKSGKRSDCTPIYISLTPITFPAPGTVGYDCSTEGCQSSNQVKVTFTHWDMRCNGALKTLLSLPTAVLTVLISLFVGRNSTL